MANSEITTDLFGQPVALPSGGRSGRRGRPAHEWSLEVENKVKLGLARGWSNERIANGIGISLPTLRRYYISALKQRSIMRDSYELNRASVLQTMANAGNVQASKELQKMIDRDDRMRPVAPSEQDAQGTSAGKKERRQARADALNETDGDPFAPGYGNNRPI